MNRRNLRHYLGLTALLGTVALLGGCAGSPRTLPPAGTTAPAAGPSCPAVTACPVCPVCPVSATEDGAERPPPQPPLQAADWTNLPGWEDDDHAAALPALVRSCSVLARQPRWKTACERAAALGPRPAAAEARSYFEREFSPWVVVNPDGSKEGLVTGYYEPLIKASRKRGGEYRWPIHGIPRDMLTIELGDLYPDLKGHRLRGRLDGNRVLPYWSRAELERMSDDLPASTLLWASDPIDLFFLQVQGSGRAELPDGTFVRLGYADQNGHPYQSIGRWLVSRGEIPLEKASMDGIKSWARTNPQRLREMLNANPSYVFFRELPASADGPTGAQGVPLTPERSIAIDPRNIPLGAPVFLASTHPLSDRPLARLVVAQDTGGAIKGAVRADFFWGFGPEAGVRAGRMRQQGKMWVLLPKGTHPD